MSEPLTLGETRTGTTESTQIYGVLAALGLSAMFAVLLCTWRYGAGASPDSAVYLSSARSLVSGKGYRLPDGQPYVTFPPLFPTLIALVTISGVDAQTAAQFLNALAFGGIVFLSGRLFLMGTASPPFALVGVLFVALSDALLDVSSMVWSEPVFVLLTLLFLLFVTRFLRTRSTASLLLVSLVAGLAWLQRYAGVPIVVAGCLLIGLGIPRASFWYRLRALACFCLIAGGPMVLWFLRNLKYTGGTGAPHFRLPSAHGLGRAITGPMNVMAEWFVPGSGSLLTPEAIHNHTTHFLKWFGPGSESAPVRVIGMVVVVLLALIGVLRTRRERAPASLPAVTPVGPAVVFTLTYLGFLAACSSGAYWDLFTHRYLVPVYVPIVLLVIVGMERSAGFLGRCIAHPKRGRLLVWSLCVLWLLYPLDNARSHVRHCRRHGVGWYSTPQWKHSPLMEWVRNHPLQGRLYSNIPDAVYVLTGIEVGTTPHYYWDAAEFARREFVSQASYIVWLHDARRDYLYDLRELLSRYRMREVATFPDGGIYQYLGEGGPPVSGVYRFWSAKRNMHFYTIQKAERDRLINQSDGTWAYEGAAFYAFAPDSVRPPDVRPVYRLSSAGSQDHFYTMDEGEKDRLLQLPSGAWTCDGIVFYAWPQAGAKDVTPVHRFWSARLGSHVYVGRESEKAWLLTEASHAWTYEGVAWYAYGPETF